MVFRGLMLKALCSNVTPLLFFKMPFTIQNIPSVLNYDILFFRKWVQNSLIRQREKGNMSKRKEKKRKLFLEIDWNHFLEMHDNSDNDSKLESFSFNGIEMLSVDEIVIVFSNRSFGLLKCFLKALFYLK